MFAIEKMRASLESSFESAHVNWTKAKHNHEEKLGRSMSVYNDKLVRLDWVSSLRDNENNKLLYSKSFFLGSLSMRFQMHKLCCSTTFYSQTCGCSNSLFMQTERENILHRHHVIPFTVHKNKFHFHYNTLLCIYLSDYFFHSILLSPQSWVK
jgi:hypothetical protein